MIQMTEEQALRKGLDRQYNEYKKQGLKNYKELDEEASSFDDDLDFYSGGFALYLLIQQLDKLGYKKISIRMTYGENYNVRGLFINKHEKFPTILGFNAEQGEIDQMGGTDPNHDSKRTDEARKLIWKYIG